MAESFNLNKFLNEQASYNLRQYTAAENGKAAMEARELETARQAINEAEGLLSLTLGAKLGIGEKVIQQIGDTAVGVVTDIVSPLTAWLEEYETVFDSRVYNAEIQSMGKQMFFTREALIEEVSADKVGQNFVYTM